MSLTQYPDLHEGEIGLQVISLTQYPDPHEGQIGLIWLRYAMLSK